MSDDRYMRRALELAAKGLGSVSPNPLVGCVIVHDDRIIGEGYHEKYGQAHAEVNAINDVADQSLLSSSTAYVTLEPCAHHGKTPPCADLLIEKKIRKVVVACEDPFDEVDGKGIDKLKKAGIEVQVGLLNDESRALNKSFLTFHEKNRPYVILKWAQTQDRYLARENYDSKWISNEKSRQLVHKWRSEIDGILVGKNTATHDNPELTVREWNGKNPLRILLDSKLEVNETQKLLSDGQPTIVLNSIKDNIAGEVRYIKLNELSPSNILQELYRLNIQSVLIEGGSAVLKSFIENNCWDEARVFTSNQNFENGIAAPKIPGEVIDEETIFEDLLTITVNTNG